MSSRDYWRKREAENLKRNLKKEKAYEEELIKIYQNMIDSIIKEIDSFYGKYARTENITLAEAKRRVSKLDIEAYERKAKRYVKEKNFSKRANEEMRLYNLTMKINRLEMLKANIALELISCYDQVNAYMANILYERAMDEFERQAGILGKTVGNNAKYAHTIVNASFHNATFSDRIWVHQEIVRAELSKLLQRGLIQGKGSSELARELRKTVSASVSDANRLMRTELARVQIDAQLDSLARNGFEEFLFIANGSCCEKCQALNDKHFKIKDVVIGENAPPMHPNCRCAIAAYEDDEEYEEWLDYLENGSTTEEYKAVKNTLKNVEQSKRQLNYEEGTVVDLKGNVIKNIKGDKVSVEVSTNLLYGNIFTHNHPNGSCFSMQDVLSFVESDLFEMRVSTPQGRYYSLRKSLKAPNVQLYEDCDKYVSKGTKKLMYKAKKLNAISRNNYISKKIELKVALIQDFLRENAEKYGYTYSEGIIKNEKR